MIETKLKKKSVTRCVIHLVESFPVCVDIFIRIDLFIISLPGSKPLFFPQDQQVTSPAYLSITGRCLLCFYPSMGARVSSSRKNAFAMCSGHVANSLAFIILLY